MAKFTDAVVATLKGYFNAGDQPTEAQFAALITAIQEGIEEHDHAGGGDGDGVSNLVGPAAVGAAPGTMRFYVYEDGGVYAMKIRNVHGAAIGHGLWVDTRWNTVGNYVLRLTTSQGTQEVMLVNGLGFVGFGTITPDNPIHGFLETAIGSADITQYPLKIEAKDEGGDFWARQGVGIQLENTASSGAFISAEIIGRVTATAGTEGDLVIKTRRSGTLTDALIVYNTGIVKIPNLAGVGNRNVVADANGNLSAP